MPPKKSKTDKAKTKKTKTSAKAKTTSSRKKTKIVAEDKKKQAKLERAMVDEKKWAFFKRADSNNRNRNIFIAVLVIAALVVGFDIFSRSDIPDRSADAEVTTFEKKKYPKMLILGIDAASWKAIDPLIAAGKMPNLQKLIENGVRAQPPTLNPTISPAIWTTIATGVQPQKHGINNFLSTREADYKQQLINSKDRRVKALWNILSEAKLTVGVFSWWATWPPEEINGFNVTERAMFDAKGGVFPQRLTQNLVINATKAVGFSIFDKNLNLIVFPEAKNPNDRDFFEQAKAQVQMLDKLFVANSLDLYKKERPDVFMQIYGPIDASQHVFTKFMYPDEFNKLVSETNPENMIDPALTPDFESIVYDLYQNQDKMLGEFMELAGPETHIIVLSDHGFFLDPAGGFRATKMNVFLNRLGVLSYTPEGQIDYAKTKAFECNNNTFDWQRRICINLEGKYAEGSVKQNQFERTRQDVINRLKRVKTTKGESIFLDVFASSKDEADIEYDLRRDLIDAEVYIQGGKHQFKDFLSLTIESGNHFSNPLGPPGIFVWSGPGIKKGVEIDTIKLTDVVPNVLHVLGLPIARDMEGNLVAELYEAPQSPDYIDSYEDNPQLIFSGGHELLEKEDNFFIDKDQFYIHSNVGGSGDRDDTFCFELAKNVDMDLKIQHIHTSPRRNIDYEAFDNPEIKQSVEIFKQKNIQDLNSVNVKQVDIRDFRFQEDSEGLYQISVPLNVNEPRVLSVWTDMSFYFDNVSTGNLRLIARGDKFQGEYPKLEFRLNGSLFKTVTINSDEFKAFDVKIPASGTLQVSYMNDDMDDKGDRNLFVQKAKFYADDIYKPKQPTEFYREDGEMCIYNRRSGTTEIYGKMLKNLEAAEYKEDTEEKILDLLQQTGEISATEEATN